MFMTDDKGNTLTYTKMQRRIDTYAKKKRQIDSVRKEKKECLKKQSNQQKEEHFKEVQ